jgi:hypothetical protein
MSNVLGLTYSKQVEDWKQANRHHYHYSTVRSTQPMSRILTGSSRRLGSTKTAKPLTIVPDCTGCGRGKRDCCRIRRGEYVSNGSSDTIDYGCVGERCRTERRPGGCSRLTHRSWSSRHLCGCRGARSCRSARGCGCACCSSWRQGFAGIGSGSMMALYRTKKCCLHCLGQGDTCRICSCDYDHGITCPGWERI